MKFLRSKLCAQYIIVLLFDCLFILFFFGVDTICESVDDCLFIYSGMIQSVSQLLITENGHRTTAFHYSHDWTCYEQKKVPVAKSHRTTLSAFSLDDQSFLGTCYSSNHNLIF